jgi:carboxypeptidase family protein
MGRNSVSMIGVVALGAVASSAYAQGSTFTGRVLTDSGVAIVGAEVIISALQRTQRSNAQGDFKFSAVPAGEHIVGVRMPGFAPKVDTIEVADAGEVHRQFKLARIEATLPLVPVTATLLDRKLSDFHSRRKFGMGRFLDSAEFANAHGTLTADKLKRFPGLTLVRGRFSDALVRSSRSLTRGAGCTAAVWIDGINLGTGYNVNQLHPGEIAAVEWYAGEATVPVQFSGPLRRGQQPGCGVLVIWLR